MLLLLLFILVVCQRKETLKRAHMFPEVHARNGVKPDEHLLDEKEEKLEELSQKHLLHEAARGNVAARRVAAIRAAEEEKNFGELLKESKKRNGFVRSGRNSRKP